MNNKLSNGWMDNCSKVTMIASEFCDSNLPTFLEINNKRVPLVIEKVFSEKVGESDYNLVLKIQKEN